MRREKDTLQNEPSEKARRYNLALPVTLIDELKSLAASQKLGGSILENIRKFINLSFLIEDAQIKAISSNKDTSVSVEGEALPPSNLLLLQYPSEETYHYNLVMAPEQYGKVEQRSKCLKTTMQHYMLCAIALGVKIAKKNQEKGKNLNYGLEFHVGGKDFLMF